jgi:hypothetical protein
MDGTTRRPDRTIEPAVATRRPRGATTTMPSLFDLTDPLEHSLRSRHRGEAWFGEVEAKLHSFRASLQRHLLAAGGEDGWVAELRADEPRLDLLARRVREEITLLDHLVTTTLASLRSPGRMARDVRQDLHRLVETTRRHRARCQRLVHEALVVDLGVC